MGTDRIAQINELLRATLARVIERDVEFPPGVIATVKRVVTSRDLSSAKVWVSVLPVEQRGAALSLLQRRLPELQRNVAQLIILQFMPKFRIMADVSEERAQRVTDLLDDLARQRRASPADDTEPDRPSLPDPP